jgi:hypothetical protein
MLLPFVIFLFWLPDKMGRPLFGTTVVNGEAIQAGELCQGGGTLLYSELAHMLLTWLLLCADAEPLCAQHCVLSCISWWNSGVIAKAVLLINFMGDCVTS